VKRTIVVATVTALAAAGVAAQAGPSEKDETSRCVVSGAETLTANEYVRVYGVDAGYRDNAFLTKVRYIRDLSPSDESDVPPGIAYVDTNCTRDPCTVSVVVRSLRDGKVVWRKKAGSPFDQVVLSQPTDQDGLALAWLETSAGGVCDEGCRVHLVKNSGDKVLAEGTDIDDEVFGELDDDRPGIIHSLGSNTFVWKRGETLHASSFND
jgi:hypothetical protein